MAAANIGQFSLEKRFLILMRSSWLNEGLTNKRNEDLMLLCSYFCITVLIPNAYNGTNVDGAVYNDMNENSLCYLCHESSMWMHCISLHFCAKSMTLSLSSSHDWPWSKRSLWAWTVWRPPLSSTAAQEPPQNHFFRSSFPLNGELHLSSSPGYLLQRGRAHLTSPWFSSVTLLSVLFRQTHRSPWV